MSQTTLVISVIFSQHILSHFFNSQAKPDIYTHSVPLSSTNSSVTNQEEATNEVSHTKSRLFLNLLVQGNVCVKTCPVS